MGALLERLRRRPRRRGTPGAVAPALGCQSSQGNRSWWPRRTGTREREKSRETRHVPRRCVPLWGAGWRDAPGFEHSLVRPLVVCIQPSPVGNALDGGREQRTASHLGEGVGPHSRGSQTFTARCSPPYLVVFTEVHSGFWM